MRKYRLVLTCGACPEQYDVFDEAGKMVGYMRLRHGNFTVSYPNFGGDTVHAARPQGDGIFTAHERPHHLMQGVLALHKKIMVETAAKDDVNDATGQQDEQWITVP